MLRIRSIKPDFWKDEGLAELSASTRLLFIGLWMLADREGRLEYRPAKIRAEIFPYHPEEPVEKQIKQLIKLGCLEPYNVDSKDYLEISGFSKHQRPNHREQPSVLPARARPGTPGQDRGDLIRSDLNRTEQNRSEGKGSPEGEGPAYLTGPDLPVDKSNRREFLKAQAQMLKKMEMK